MNNATFSVFIKESILFMYVKQMISTLIIDYVAEWQVLTYVMQLH
jgi:hypothetical protein